MPCPILRKNEQLLRRCSSIEKAKSLVPDLIYVSQGIDEKLVKIRGKTPLGKPIYQLVGLDDYCFYIPGFLDSDETLGSEILTKWIDSPPHSNSLKHAQSNTTLWNEYMSSPSTCRLQHLRWSCVGYHYNWTDRSYDPECKSEFPTSFSEIYNTVLSNVNGACNLNLKGNAESAIINFYHAQRVSDRLGGHRDDVELTDDSPLVSGSMGQSAVLLIEDTSIVLSPGDVVVMAGKARQSLHAIPCVFSKKKRTHAFSSACTEFLSKTRISISIRQVY